MSTPAGRSTKGALHAGTDDRTGLDLVTLRRAFFDHLYYTLGRLPLIASAHDVYLAGAYTVRDRLVHRWLSSLHCLTTQQDARVVAYFSAEYLLGPHLANNLINLGIYKEVEDAFSAEARDLDKVLQQEEEPGLGNGGLGRLAACYLDSLATLEIPAVGYGIRYEFGIFDQAIRDGWQIEKTDKWLRFGNPWEIARPELAVEVKLGGRTEGYTDAAGRFRARWVAGRLVKGIPHDTPILGYAVNTCNTLRLWKAEAVESFDFEAFNVGDYYRAVDEKVASENLTKVLYPNDEPVQGKRLRLEQQFFFVSCSLQDMLRIHKRVGRLPETFHQFYAVQLNDTHPAIAVAELMRLLIDEHDTTWETAWDVTRKTFSYTNHTLLPEALETWPLPLFQAVLPRHLEIIYEINRRFLDEVRARYPGDSALIRRISLIDESGDKRLRMAHLAVVGSHKVNGVAALHSELLQRSVMQDFFKLTPDKFCNITNGVTPRRWMVLSNPALTELISTRIGRDWIKDLSLLRQIEPLAGDGQFREAWQQVKQANKQRLAAHILECTGTVVDPHSLFDVQVKRIHEYKRQHLSALHIITLYQQLHDNPNLEIPPRCFIFGGKAAPGYFMAKLIIKLINSIAQVVNNDPVTKDRLKVVFIPDFNVKNSQVIYPAADLSEQISLAGKEASGTGNMKFSLNGALTIGTLDGANVEIRQEVGADNFFLFGLSADEVAQLWKSGYRPHQFYERDAELRHAIDLLAMGTFSQGDTTLFQPLVDHLLNRDDYMVLADYRSYLECQREVGALFQNSDAWTQKAILNVARCGKFSSDRAIREYCADIWNVAPVRVELL
jgi:starch phosphorylase